MACDRKQVLSDLSKVGSLVICESKSSRGASDVKNARTQHRKCHQDTVFYPLVLFQMYCL